MPLLTAFAGLPIPCYEVGAQNEFITPTVHSCCGYLSSNPCSKSVDGNLNSWWQHNSSHEHWIIFDLGDEYLVHGWYRWTRATDGSREWWNVNLYISNDPTTWGTTVGTRADWKPKTNRWRPWDFTGQSGRYVKVTVTHTGSSGSGVTLALDEAKIYI